MSTISDASRLGTDDISRVESTANAQPVFTYGGTTGITVTSETDTD
jgi:hypothetical protein